MTEQKTWTFELDAVPSALEWKVGARIVGVQQYGDGLWRGTVSFVSDDIDQAIGKIDIDHDNGVVYRAKNGEGPEEVARIVLDIARQLKQHDDDLRKIVVKRRELIDGFNNPQPESA